MEITDQLNRIVKLSETPKRIVSLVPSQTELLVDLGLREKLVGITKFCVHPENLRVEKTVVGGTKNVNYTKIAALLPDIIICNKEENTEEMVKELENIAPVWISDIETRLDSTKMISQLGEIFDKVREASEIIDEINTEAIIHQEFVQTLMTKKVLYLIWKNPFIAAGRSTFINAMLQENNFENVFEDINSRYPEVKNTDFEKANLILLSTEPFPFKNEDVVALADKYKTEVKLVDGEYFSWYGSRLANAYKYFKTLH